MEPRKIIAELKSVLQVYIEDDDGPADAQKRRAAMAVRQATAYLAEPEESPPMGTRRDDLLICAITDRAYALGQAFWRGATRRRMQMSITKLHRNGCPLDLDGLLKSTNEKMIEDVRDILEHLDPKTGQLPYNVRLNFATPMPRGTRAVVAGLPVRQNGPTLAELIGGDDAEDVSPLKDYVAEKIAGIGYDVRNNRLDRARDDAADLAVELGKEAKKNARQSPSQKARSRRR